MSAMSRVALFVVACFALIPLDAAAWDRGRVERFASLPAGALNPEGITVDRHNGDVYVTGFNPTGAGTGQIYVLNALTFDRAGNVYISASFQGIIWRTGPAGGPAVNWASDALLTPNGFPPFGANGLEFNHDQSALFVANTANDTVIRIPVSAGGAAGKAEVFTNSINGADGLFLDQHDNVWVCANQSDEIVVTDKTGKVIAKLGDFDGVRDGSPVGLLFPASLVRRGEWIYITNLSLDLQQSVDSQWAAKVKTHTISRIRFRIPGSDPDAD